MCRISVVIPVYNAEGPLPACVSSILAGAPEDLELILVEDGSPDSSAAVCDRLAAQDSRIRALHQSNAGASAARNAGLDAASGDYVTFVDADDRLLPGLWESALPVLREQHPDLYVFGVDFAVGSPELPSPAGCWQTPAQLPELADVLRRQMVGGCTLTGPVAKFYRRQALGALRFDTALKINEDFLFNAEFLAHCGPLVFDSTAYYRYENAGTGSLSRQLRGDLLEAEAYTRPAFAAMLQALQLSAEQQQELLDIRAKHCALAQFGLLAGQKGTMPLSQRTALTRQIFAVPGVREQLRQTYRDDPSRLLALPYRFCLALNAPALLAAYCAAKSRFL